VVLSDIFTKAAAAPKNVRNGQFRQSAANTGHCSGKQEHGKQEQGKQKTMQYRTAHISDVNWVVLQSSYAVKAM